MLLFTLFVGFVVGALTIIAVEALGLLVVIGRLSRRVKQDQEKAASKSPLSLDPFSHIEKQGVVWVFKPEKVPKLWSVDKVPREHKRKKEILEVTPLRKFAKIKDKLLILADSDGTLRKIQLKGCTVAAVSATMLSSRKWAKRYPIKLDNETTILYEGSKTFYMYLETSWEKESWCKALRIASCTDQEKLKWFSQLNLEFQSYLASLNTGYPLFMKPSVVLDNEPMDRSAKLDNSSSRVRQYLKKFSRKVSKSGTDNKMSWTVSSGREERKIGEKCYSLQDSVSGSGVIKGASIGKAPNLSAEGKMVQPSPTVSNSGSGGHNTFLCDSDYDDKIGGDEEALCWNLLISRFFFDAKRNMVIKNSIQSRIQRTLSNMRTPSYMGEITCTGVDLGSLPPYLTGMRVLPSDMSELWALEIDFQYSGGVVLHVESRLEVCASDLMEGKVDTNIETSYMKEVPTDILEGFEYLGKQLELSEGTVDTTEPKDETGSELDGMRTSESNRKASPSASKWKSVLNSVAKQVSQVPLSMAIKVASLRGTLRLHIKPPPSDQLWFGFTTMPDIVFELESFVGEHKINSGHIALFLISRFKAAIRETLVLPNCESVCIPWMLAEKDDWVPSKVAPFMWTTNNQEVVEAPAASATTTNTIAAANRETIPQGSKLDKGKKAEESTAAGAAAAAGANLSTLGHKSLEELRTPLLSSSNVERQLSTSHSDSSKEEEQVLDRQSTSSSQSSTLTMEGGDDGRLKRMGTRARMLGLGKKMGEKLEEKRRHIEERGRHMVERMKGP